jgi:hypothetical protein
MPMMIATITWTYSTLWIGFFTMFPAMWVSPWPATLRIMRTNERRLCTALGRDKTTNSEIPGREIGHHCLLALVVGPLRPRHLFCKLDASLMLKTYP